MSTVRALVLTGFGLNCDLETAYALERAGAQAERVHLNTLAAGEKRLEDYQVFVVGGGFSWADEHGAGVILGMRLRHRLGDEVLRFVDRGGLVLGICNGFQVLVNLGLLPGFEPGALSREVAIVPNDCGNFVDRWVMLAIDPESPCIFTRGMERIELPVRHGEGKFYAQADVLEKLEAFGQVAVRYALPNGSPAENAFPHNPNGSLRDVAGICDPTGRVFALMPHPEAYNHFTNHPDWTRVRETVVRQGLPLPEEGEGIRMFRNAVEYFD
jgi:phosphoribosylformylglycinamidine synthase